MSLLNEKTDLIEKEILDGNYDNRPVIDRYYTKKYLCDPSGDICFLIHSNKLVVITLAPTHPIISKNLTVSNVMFQISDKVNRIDNSVSGKGKRGAQQLLRHSVVCKIQCKELPDPFSVPAGMVAKLLEVNEKLRRNPQLIKCPQEGYIAIMGPRMSDYETQIGRLVSESEYKTKTSLVTQE